MYDRRFTMIKIDKTLFKDNNLFNYLADFRKGCEQDYKILKIDLNYKLSINHTKY